MPTEKHPVGTILPFGGGTVPAGWLLCDGSAVSRTGRADLFAVISTDFGAGDGSTTFNLPDGRQRMGLGSNVTASGGTGGTLDHTHSTVSHAHTATQPSDHGTHQTQGGHTHDSHTTANRLTGLTTTPFVSPIVHSSVGDHAHDAHSAHAGFAITDGGAGTSGSGNPGMLAADFIIASHNTYLQSFDVAQEHAVTRSLRVRKTISIAQEHAVTRGLDVAKTVNLAQEHLVSMSRRVVAFREFEIAQEHAVTFTTVKIFVRSFSIAQEHDVTARVEIDFDDVPSGGGGETIVRRVYLFDD